MKLESHYTPKHGNWLNIAEIEASVPRRQRLDDRRLPKLEILACELQRGTNLQDFYSSRERVHPLTHD
jgi:hypothetical protein